jgi:predicted CxxxxCH...CXXCH cytochrome family protein
VGAHASHLASSTTHAPIACAECHAVPAAVADLGHVDSALPAEVTFGPLARARGAQPVYDGVGCSNVACHGGAEPVWTIVNGSQAACGTCHGTPPALPHPQQTLLECTACHGSLDARHIDGKVDVACNACHGNDDGPAPPFDLAGNEDPIAPGVGAHASHLRATELHEPVACSECHVVPTMLDAPAHRDGDARAEIHFGPLASAEDTDASYNGVTCATYCHGGSAFIQGGSLTNPTWTVVDGTQAACGSCHGLPPPAPHPTAPPTACGGCHPFSGLQPLMPALHINGVVERP